MGYGHGKRPRILTGKGGKALRKHPFVGRGGIRL